MANAATSGDGSTRMPVQAAVSSGQVGDPARMPTSAKNPLSELPKKGVHPLRFILRRRGHSDPQRRRGLRDRSTIRVVLKPGTRSTSTTSPPCASTSSRPTTWAGR